MVYCRCVIAVKQFVNVDMCKCFERQSRTYVQPFSPFSFFMLFLDLQETVRQLKKVVKRLSSQSRPASGPGETSREEIEDVTPAEESEEAYEHLRYKRSDAGVSCP